eukprot:gene319-biopygen293
MLAEGSRGMGQAHARGIAHLLVATGLLMVGDGKSRSLDVNSVGMRNYRLKKSGKTIPVTVADSIRQQGAALVEYNPAQPPLPVSGCLYVTTRSQSGLPASIGRLSFVVGSRPVNLRVNNRTQHSFDFTTDAATATLGVYLPGGVEYGYETRQRERHADAAPRERSPVGDRMEMLGDSQATQRLATQAAPRPQHKRKSRDDLERARDTSTRFPLNGESSLEGAPRVCTRSWQLHEKRPHHVSEAAWLAVTEPVREHHIRCLKNLKNMPFELLEQNIVSAILEIVRRTARQRKWQPSTWAKELAAYAGAMRDLPLYTTESQGVRLSAYPEWNAAVRTVKRLEREMDPGPPEPITFGQYTSAVKGLRRVSPRAALFLSMMWAMASRAGDIPGLRQKDVTLATSVRPDGPWPWESSRRSAREPASAARIGQRRRSSRRKPQSCGAR